MKVREEVLLPDQLNKIVKWSDEDCVKKVDNHVLDDNDWNPMKSLLKKLLKRNPEERHRRWADIIEKLKDSDILNQVREIKDVVVVTKDVVVENNNLLHAQSVMLQDIKLSIIQIPNLMVTLQQVKFPYMFRILTREEFASFQETKEERPSMIEQASNEAQKMTEFSGRFKELFECCRDFLDSLKKKETATAIKNSSSFLIMSSSVM